MSTFTKSNLEMCDFVPNIPAVYNKKIKKMSEVAVGGGGVSKLQTKSEVLCFFNLSLSWCGRLL